MAVQQITILGFKRFSGDVEGKKYDFTKVLLQMPVSSRNENAMGFDAVESICGDSSLFEKFLSMKGRLPAAAAVDLEMTNKGYEVISVVFPAVQKAA